MPVISKGVISSSIAVFYLLIGLEIVIMISPFAAYFYAVYGPALNFLYDYKITAWLTGFFLPHAVVSNSSLLNFLNRFGRTLFSLGLIAFLIAAIQVYSAKFRRKGVVTGFVYRWIRHPQYLFLAIAGSGLLLFWPRFVILILYMSMLFVYYILARHEEQRMLDKHRESYQAYMQRTAMFLPGEPGGKIFRALFGWIKSPRWAISASYGVTLLLAVLMAFSLRHYTISQTSMVYLPERRIAAISVLPQSDKYLLDILNIAFTDSTLNATLAQLLKEGHQGFLVHILPQHYMMQGLFVQPVNSSLQSRRRFSWRSVLSFLFPVFSSHRHHQMMGTMDAGAIRLVFSQLNWPDGTYAPATKAMSFTVKHLPLFLLDIELKNHRVQSLQMTPHRNLWGEMPMPLF